MKLITCMHTDSKCYKTNEKAIQRGIVVHSTGANNKSLARYVQPSKNDVNYNSLIAELGKNKYGNHWNRNVRKAVHYFIGTLANGEVATAWVLPEDICAWGVGKGKNGSYNYNPTAHIQFEVCEDNLKDKTYFTKIYKEAVELCADICKRHGWKVDVIVSHKECGAKGYGSKHKDINHWLAEYGKTMDDFRKDVDKLLNPTKEVKEFPAYKVKVTTKALNIRKGAGTDFKKVGCIKDKGVYTIVDESSGKGATKWGKLKSGAGWISLDYCKKI